MKEKFHEGHMKPEARLSQMPGGSVLDAAVLGFAGFTVLCHAAVAFSLGLETLIRWSLAASGLGLFIWIRMRRRTPQPRIDPADPESRLLESRAIPGGAALQGVLWGLAVLGVGLHLTTGSLIGYWACALLASLLALGRLAFDPPLKPRLRCTGKERMALAALSLLCAVAVATAHHGDADDAFYVNLSVFAVDHPEAPLLAGDTLHGFKGVPMSLPVFHLLSYELLQAAVAHLARVPALTVVHLWVPPLVALLIPLAWARLAMLLMPRRWLPVVTVLIAQLFLLGDGHASSSDFALLRLQQGKSVLLMIGLPLLASYGLQFGAEPSWRRWLPLAAMQISAVGLSTSALWLAPCTSLLAVCAALPLHHSARATAAHSARALGAGFLASLYPLTLALTQRGETLRAFREAVQPLPSLEWTGPELMNHALTLVAGDGRVAGLLLLCAVAVLALPGSALFRRYAAVSCAAFFVVFFDPWLARLVAHQITGADTYFRVFWLLPLPLFVAAVLTAPLERPPLSSTTRQRVLAWANTAVATSILLLLPSTYTLSEANQVRLDWPGPKVPPEQFAAAQQLARVAGPGEFVLASPLIARWVPLLQQHPAPLMVREMHLDRLHQKLGAEELMTRRVLSQMAGGVAPTARGLETFSEAITRYPLAAVALSGAALARPDVRAVLKESRLEVSFRDAQLEIWSRRKSPLHADP